LSPINLPKKKVKKKNPTSASTFKRHKKDKTYHIQYLKHFELYKTIQNDYGMILF